MTQRRIRTALMDGAIQVVARDGLDKLTTRSIASECKLHDAYIYRYFIDKEDLLKRAFLREDQKIIDMMLNNMEGRDETNMSLEEKIKALWIPAWEYLIDNPDSCKFYVRYYYSVHFERDAMDDFKENNKVLRKRFDDIIGTDSDVEMLFHYNIDTLLHLAMKVATGEIEYTNQRSEEILKLLCSVNYAYINNAM